ncbi:MAG: S46 family peptidase [Candidatus Limimorpha sp.]
MKKLSLFFAVMFAMTSIIKADEGMWLPMFVERLNYVDMEKMGLQLTPEELYSINNSSLKDAIVGLSNDEKPRGFFCTGEIVSANSLLFTNHHCGYSSIAALSTVEHDYLNEGFWAKDFSEELPAGGVSASFLVRMEDVTEEIFSVVNDTMDFIERNFAIKNKIKEIEESASEDGKLNPVIKSFFEGNEYYMFVYKTYTDVRLVGTAPQSIGKFGGDTDNWMWPRHTCDFSVFRVYADENGEPAAYSENNKPLTPKYHLPISLDGVKENDFTMIWGFPGSTERYMTSYGINFNVDYFYPIVYEVFKAETDVMDKYMKIDKAVNINYADIKAGFANTWKNFEGQMKMLRKNKVAERKAELENDFAQWVSQDENRKAEYGEVLPTLEVMYQQLSYETASLYFPNFLSQLNPVGIAAEFLNYYTIVSDKEIAKEVKKEETDKLKELDVDAMFEGLDARVEHDMLIEVMKIYARQFETEELPASIQALLKKYKGDWNMLAEAVASSMFSDPEQIKAFIEKPNVKKLEKDPAMALLLGLNEQIMAVIPVYKMANAAIAENDHLFVKGLREFYAETQPDKVLYPDANSTLRMSYGSVKDYQPADAISYDYVCTANGILEKYIPGDFEFDSPKRLIDLIEARDFGQYADENGELITCFLSTNDITGGNSGSPIMNGKGELIGLAFDGNWEAMSGDVNFEPNLQRTINVDIRYVLFIIDKLSGATNIIDELDIRKSMPQPIRTEDCVAE